MIQAGKDHLFRRWQSWDPTDFNSSRRPFPLGAKSYCRIAVVYRCAGLWILSFRVDVQSLGQQSPWARKPLTMDCLICFPQCDIYSV